jgi:eukaryotic-like serine/threonine-protein kinase
MIADALDAARAEIGADPTEIEIRRALIDAELVADRTSDGPGRVSRPLVASWTLARTAVGLFAVFGLIFASGTAIQLLTREHAPGPRRSSSRLEPLPTERAYLRVVAHPWAHVIVDGQRVDTTPFARPIPLGAGTHYVRLEHPNAPTERRTVNLTAGETLLLDVNLKIERPLPPVGDGVSRPLGDSGLILGPESEPSLDAPSTKPSETAGQGQARKPADDGP